MRVKVTGRKDLFGNKRPDEIIVIKKEREGYSKTGFAYRTGFPYFLGEETLKGIIKKLREYFHARVVRLK